jgi:hypothetical protein
VVDLFFSSSMNGVQLHLIVADSHKKEKDPQIAQMAADA